MENNDMYTDLSALFKLFGDSTRLRILHALEQKEMCVCDIAELLGLTKSAVKRCMNKHGDIFFDLLKLKRADNLAQAPEYHNRTEYVDRIQKIAEDIIANQECFSLKQVAVNGSDLIKVGFTPGKLIGECLNDILDKIIKGELDNDKQILLDYAVKKYL